MHRLLGRRDLVGGIHDRCPQRLGHGGERLLGGGERIANPAIDLRALGRPGNECWSEIWNVLRPLIETPFNGGPATWIEDFELEIRRHGYLEEGHFTVAYSPVPDETAPGGIGGVLATVHEISSAVFGKRRVAALRDLGSRAGEAKTAEEACAIAAQTLAPYGKDLPFVLLYLLDAKAGTAKLAGTAGVGAGEEIAPPVQVRVHDAFGNLVTGWSQPVVLTLTGAPEGATLGGTTSRTPNGGIATYDDLVVDAAGTGFGLRAASGALPQVQSAAFDVTAGAAASTHSAAAATRGRAPGNIGQPYKKVAARSTPKCQIVQRASPHSARI